MKFYQKWTGENLSSEKGFLFPAKVPGNIQSDFAVAKNFGDIQFADNHKKFIPYEDDFWQYSTTLSYDKRNGEKVFFVSRGINYKCDISLNGEKLLFHEGMFSKIEIDLTEKLKMKDNVLTVTIYPHPKRKGADKDTRDEADDSVNPPVYYGWDWNPRLLISGIWDETYIETRDEFFIGNCEVITSLSDDFSIGTVNCSFDSDKSCDITLYDQKGKKVYCGKNKTFTVNNPNLWWCNGQGEPYLYSYEITNGKEKVTGKVGFKKLRLLQNAGATGPEVFPKTRYEAPMTIELNGRRIFAKGSNWVNPELFWGEITKERYEKLILLAKECNMNILRMWGGAGAPKESFYDICDRVGILLWQEFPLACNNYKDGENYMRILEQEATAMIKKFRSHPSLCFWCGGNELFNSWSGMDEQSKPLRLLNKLCYELDYDRPFLYTSPLYGVAHGGYMLYATDQGGDPLQQFQKANNIAYTEFGVPAIADMDTLKDIIPKDELFPINPTDAWIAHHGFYAWGKSTWVCQDVFERYFGTPKSLEEFIEKAQWLESEGYRGAFEEMRRQWPHCSMAINWCFNEPWKTVAGNNLIAYPDKPRKCYYYVKNALRPTLFSAKVKKLDFLEGDTFEAEIWLINDSNEKYSGKVKVTAKVGDKVFDLSEYYFSVSERENQRGATVRFVLPAADTDRIILSLKADGKTDSEYEFLYRRKEIKEKTKQLNV